MVANERRHYTKIIRVVRILTAVCCYYTYTYFILIPPIFVYSDAFAPSNLSILGLLTTTTTTTTPTTTKADANAEATNIAEIEQDCDVIEPLVEPKAWMIPDGIKFGRLDRLKLLKQNQQNDDDDDDDNNAKIATKAIGLNFADIFTILGLYSAANIVRQQQKPKRDDNDNSNDNNNDSFIPGLEFAGTIIDDPTGTYQKYDRVCGFTRFGAYADIVSVPPTYLLIFTSFTRSLELCTGRKLYCTSINSMAWSC
jgi:hypothetical protein